LDSDLMHRGYVLLWRKIEDSGWIRNHKLCSFWLWCLIKASYKHRKVLFGRQEIDLEPGQFIMGRKSAGEATGLTEQEVRSATATLVGSRNLTIKSTNKFSIVSIVNWDIYQNTDSEINQQINQPATNKQPTNNHKQELKKEKNNTYTEEFLNFWDAYPNRIGKAPAFKSWNNNGRPSLEVILSAIKTQKTWRANKKPGEFRPEWKNPSTWLNQKSWEDEVEIEKYTSEKPIITG